MKNSVYISTGCFTGRVNGRNPHLLSRFHDKMMCDGFELMIFEDLYADIENTVKEYRSLGIKIPVLHMNKNTGDFCSTPGDENLIAALDIVKRDCEIALAVGATKCVFHPWGIPDSDKYPEMLYERMEILVEEGKKYDLTLLPENCVCTNSTPLKNLQNALTRYPFSVTADTRASAFHGETNETLDALLPDSVGHFHIIDYEGAPGDWTARKAIRQPGEGGIDWDAFFARLKKHSYNGTLTLESSNILPDTVDFATFNKSVEFIKNGLK